MISIQEKTEEYRDITHYWERRLFKEDNDKIVPKDFSTVEFRNGYQKDARRIKFEFKGISIGSGREEWGAIPGKDYYIIKLGRKITD